MVHPINKLPYEWTDFQSPIRFDIKTRWRMLLLWPSLPRLILGILSVVVFFIIWFIADHQLRQIDVHFSLRSHYNFAIILTSFFIVADAMKWPWLSYHLIIQAHEILLKPHPRGSATDTFSYNDIQQIQVRRGSYYRFQMKHPHHRSYWMILSPELAEELHQWLHRYHHRYPTETTVVHMSTRLYATIALAICWMVPITTSLVHLSLLRMNIITHEEFTYWPLLTVFLAAPIFGGYVGFSRNNKHQFFYLTPSHLRIYSSTVLSESLSWDQIKSIKPAFMGMKLELKLDDSYTKATLSVVGLMPHQVTQIIEYHESMKAQENPLPSQGER